MPANRTAALGAALTAAVTAFVTLLGAIPSPTGKAVVVSVALVVLGAVAIVFLIGHQKYEQRTHSAAESNLKVSLAGGSGRVDPPQTGTTISTSTKPKPSGGASAVSNITTKRMGF